MTFDTPDQAHDDETVFASGRVPANPPPASEMPRTFASLDWDHTYARLPDTFFQRVHPTPLPEPRLLAWNPEVAALFDLDPAEFARAEAAEYLSGNRPLPGAAPLAMLYAGHQFGTFVPQLGDGRAILLGEVRNTRGERWDLQLKGSGPTAFSRGFDGRSVVRSAIREYLASAAMTGLGVPTTQALSLVHAKAQPVYREKPESAAAILRVAPSHVRFGHFEAFAFHGRRTELQILADYVLREFYPELAPREDRYPALLRAVTVRTATLMARWMAVGFCHGVMNTDNFSILGLTLDYGPYAFLDTYDPGFICNHTDTGGRYAYDKQPGIGQWNCMVLANAFLPLISEEQASDALDAYAPAFEAAYGAELRAKLGLATQEPEDARLAGVFLALMAEHRADFTNTFRALCDCGDAAGPADADLRLALGDGAAVDAWLQQWRARLRRDGRGQSERQAAMRRANPRYILRNYMAQQAITAVEQHDDPTEIHRLQELLRDPFTERPGFEGYAAAPPDWGRHLQISCSS
jgi:uncharacterized protein YdiU (UPF0061 family)